MIKTNKLLVGTGIITLIQAASQAMFAAFAIAQYLCVIDFLKQSPLLVLIRILYFNNPDRCGTMINIGQVYDDMADQAFVLVSRQPFTTHRTFLINSVSLGLSVAWIIGSLLLIKGGTRRHHSNHTHWPWLVITLLITLLDFVALIAFANDSFHTQTLNDVMTYISGATSGVGNIQVNTFWVSWSMVILYSRFGIFIIANVTLMICGVVDCTRCRSSVTSSDGERNRGSSLEVIQEAPDSSPRHEVPTHNIPRIAISRSFRAMKNFLYYAASGRPASLNENRYLHRGVNFPEDIELPTLEHMVSEQQRRLNASVVDTSGRRSPGQGSRNDTRLHNLVNLPDTSTGQRGRTGALQGQMPWAYIPASSSRMRDQLPADEDLPPVPLPDYTAYQSARTASVHRAASSLSSLTHKKEYTSYQSPHQQPARVTTTRLPEPVQVASDETPVSETSDEDSVYSLVTMGRPEGWVPTPPPPPDHPPPRAMRPMPPQPAMRPSPRATRLPRAMRLPHPPPSPMRLPPPPPLEYRTSPLHSVVGTGICGIFLVAIGLYCLITIFMSIMKHWKHF